MKNSTLTLQKKHPLSIRWNHWVNFPIFFIMVLSGLGIYWANAVYILPRGWLDAWGLDHKLGLSLAWHWAFAVVFTVNGLLYALFLLTTGHWRYLLPKPCDLKQAVLVAAHDFKLIKEAPPADVKYNSAQKIAYSGVFFLGVIMALTGFAIYKPTQLGWLTALFGGYEGARFVHFYVTVLFLFFFLIHILQVIRSGWNQFRAMITGLERVDE